MIFITSISPDSNSLNRQIKAVQSWQRYNLPIISINHYSEIEILEPNFPNVVFLPAQRTAFKQYHKHYIYIFDLIHKAFNITQDDSIFLINSDIILENIEFKPTQFHKSRKITNEIDYFEYLSNNSLICFKRFDKTEYKLEIWPYGNDGFIINRKFLHLIKDNNFVLGQCFWDWYIPMIFFVNKLMTWTFDRPYLIHELHERNHNEEQWNLNLELFKKEFYTMFENDKVLTFIYRMILKENNRTCNDLNIIL